MALVSEPRPGRVGGGYRIYGRRRRTRYLVGGLIALVVLVVAAALVALASASASLSVDSSALAKVGMPLGGGRIESISVVTGPHSRPVPVAVRGGQIWPRGSIRAGQAVSIQVVVRRPGWISWLTGKRDRVTLSLVAPTVAPSQTYLTLAPRAPLRLSFDHPVAAIAYGSTPTDLSSRVLSAPASQIVLPRSGAAGTAWVSATARSWETAPASAISWFPIGVATAAVASPAPGSSIGPATPIALTFAKPVSDALGSSLPPVSPLGAGHWQQVSSHTIVFRPSGYGYGLGATVKVGLPSGVRLVGVAGRAGTWHVPAGSTLRLQQLLANLGYLPLRFQYAPGVRPSRTPQAQEAAALRPPNGTFTWRYRNVPGALRNMWAPGTFGEMTKGAIMAFENDQGMTADGIAGPAVWRALLAAGIASHGTSFGYTFVMVSENSPESINVWHSGRTVVTGPVNTGIPQAPTAQGTFAVFEHALSVTMSGTNPDGSHYDDPGVPYVSYFNGGDALHGFLRASYGSAQSLGCVEMPYSEAAAVYPYTPIGTLVNVT